MIEKKPDKSNPDRPIECSECKRAIAVCYIEIVGHNMVRTSMCAECPELQRRLYGTNPKELVANQLSDTELVCGNCGTTLEDIRRGHNLGCAECYNVFSGALLKELQSLNRLPSRVVSEKKVGPIHIGRTPGEKLTINLSSKLLALNEALKETLKREDYEEAALLRDQIKALTQQNVIKELPESTGAENESI